MITNIKTKGLRDYFTKHVKRIVNKLSLNKFYKEECEIIEIDENERDLYVIVDNNGRQCSLNIPKTSIGNNRDEDIFIENLMNNAQ